MKRSKILLRGLQAFFLVYLSFFSNLWSQDEPLKHSSFNITSLSSKPLHQVASLGASTTGPLVEGSTGAIHKGCRHRFYCHSTGPTEGFLGPQALVEPISLKDQPGVFPAPLMGAAAVTFHFSCQDSDTCVTPIVVRPDGTVFPGLPLTSKHSSQTVVITSPAQTGIYTLFVLPHQKDSLDAHIIVDASISTQPNNNKTFQLKSFKPNDKDADLISAEFIYIPNS